MKQRIITFLICSAAAVAVMAGVHMSSTHYDSGQNIVIAYDGLPAGAEVLIYKGLSLQPMLEAHEGGRYSLAGDSW